VFFRQVIAQVFHALGVRDVERDKFRGEVFGRELGHRRLAGFW
jgi:hypothetical protein